MMISVECSFFHVLPKEGGREVGLHLQGPDAKLEASQREPQAELLRRRFYRRLRPPTVAAGVRKRPVIQKGYRT